MIDPRDHPLLWMMMRCTGGTDAWTDPFDDEDEARADRAVAWTTAIGATILALTLVSVVLVEAARWV